MCCLVIIDCHKSKVTRHVIRNNWYFSWRKWTIFSCTSSVIIIRRIFLLLSVHRSLHRLRITAFYSGWISRFGIPHESRLIRDISLNRRFSMSTPIILELNVFEPIRIIRRKIRQHFALNYPLKASNHFSKTIFVFKKLKSCSNKNRCC